MAEVFRRHRYPTDFPVKVLLNGVSQAAKIIDVNEMGARIVGTINVERGQKITLLANSERFEGIVRWVGEDRLGLTFRPMLTSRQVDLMRHAAKPAHHGGWNRTALQEMR